MSFIIILAINFFHSLSKLQALISSTHSKKTTELPSSIVLGGGQQRSYPYKLSQSSFTLTSCSHPLLLASPPCNASNKMQQQCYVLSYVYTNLQQNNTLTRMQLWSICNVHNIQNILCSRTVVAGEIPYDYRTTISEQPGIQISVASRHETTLGLLPFEHLGG